MQDSQNTPSTTNLEEEQTVDALGKDGNASMPEQVKRPNPCKKKNKKMMMMMMTMMMIYTPICLTVRHDISLSREENKLKATYMKLVRKYTITGQKKYVGMEKKLPTEELYLLLIQFMGFVRTQKKLPGYVARMMNRRNMNRISQRFITIKGTQGLSFIC